MIFGDFEVIEFCERTGVVRLIRGVSWQDDIDRLGPEMGCIFENYGWGNGYVALPKENPFHGYHYDHLNELFFGGFPEVLTWSNYALDMKGHNFITPGMWLVGFDTAHGWNNSLIHTRDWVIEATQVLKDLITLESISIEQLKGNDNNQP